jgi:cell division septation protein DedD
MNDDDSRSKPADRRDPSFAPDPSFDGPRAGKRQDPVFSDFDEDYEESERDTDYASAYEEEESEEDDYLEAPDEDDSEERFEDWQALPGGEPDRSRVAGKNPWDVESSAAPGDAARAAEDREPAFAPELFEDEEEDDRADDDAREDWDEEEDYPDATDEHETESGERAHSWPLGLILVGLVALVLLAAGGYGVIQQRSADQEQIRELQAALSTAANPKEVAETRETLRQMQEQAEKNMATIEVLTLYNERLTDTVAGLEKQLAAQQTLAPGASGSTPAVAEPVARKIAPEPTSAETTTVAGGWFVNFSSYSQRVAADKWVKKLSPLAGKAVVIPTDKDGTTLYRVRVVGLADRAEAEKVAGQLQSAHNLTGLWVGKE